MRMERERSKTRWMKNEEGVLSENNRPKERQDSTNRRAQNSRVLFCSDHKPKSASVRVHTCACVCAYVSVRARELLSCCVYLCESFTVNKARFLAGRQVQQAGPKESYCNSGRERESERKRATLLKVPNGQSFEVAHIGIL